MAMQTHSQEWSALHQRSFEFLENAANLVIKSDTKSFDLRTLMIKDAVKILFPEIRKELSKRPEKDLRQGITFLVHMLGDVLDDGHHVSDGQ